jgi:PAS domain S-box-containing protein
MRQRSQPHEIFKEQDFERVLEHLPVPIIVASIAENPRILFVNRQFTETFGYRVEDIPTQAHWAGLACRDAAYRTETFRKWNQDLERALKGGGVVDAMEFEVTAKNGDMKNVLFSATVFGEYLQVTLTDVTMMRSAEDALNTARERLGRAAYEVTESIPAGTYSMVLKPGEALAKFTFMSSRFLEICGLDREAAEADPLNAFECVHPDDRPGWIQKNAEAFERKSRFSEEARLVVNGKLRWIHAESIPIDAPDGSVIWQGVLTDITPRKKAEHELAQIREQEKRKEADQREWLERKLRISLSTSAMAHEINQPLSRLRMATEMEYERAKQHGDAKQISFLKGISNDIGDVVETIQRMATLMRSFSARSEPLDLWDVIESSLLSSRPYLRRHRIQCQTSSPPSHPCRILGTPSNCKLPSTTCCAM